MAFFFFFFRRRRLLLLLQLRLAAVSTRAEDLHFAQAAIAETGGEVSKRRDQA